MYLLGYDIGSSSIKAALVHAETGRQLGVAQSPEVEMEIVAEKASWAEQEPEIWWKHVCLATKKLLQQTAIAPTEIKGIGIAYQMHGLVLVDKDHQVLRPAIIWCDSRAVELGQQAFAAIGEEKVLGHLLNSPGNFTAAKLKWVKEHEPEVYDRIHKAMLPGDYIAMRLTGEIATTISGLSEGVFWDFKHHQPAEFLLEHFGFHSGLLPNLVETFSEQGQVISAAANVTGLAVGTSVNYRAGDQPNNALSLNVLEAGEIAATGGTSGVVYGLVDELSYDPASRVNGFAHVNHTAADPRIGILLCINGAGSQYRWLKQQMTKANLSYPDMEQLAASILPGSDGLRILPFGNGAERMLENKAPGAQINNLQFNRHHQAHLIRAALEGIAFSFVYGIGILQEMGLSVDVIRVGNDNLFQSAVFAQTISNVVGSRIEVLDTTGAIGAAKAAGVAAACYRNIREAVTGNQLVTFYEPIADNDEYLTAYQRWHQDLKYLLK